MNTYTFHRKDGWYPLELKDDAEAIRNAEINPGTLKVVNETTERVVWTSPNREVNEPGSE